MIQSRESRIQLVKFDRQWSETVVGWIDSPEKLLHWSARADFPLTDVSVFDEWRSDPEITPYVLLLENEMVAYGEVWLDEADGSAELGRMIVAPNHCRQGFGTLLIERLIFVAHDAGYREVWVRVFSTNVPAINCYESSGFTRVSAEKTNALNAAQRFSFIWMRRSMSSSTPR